MDNKRALEIINALATGVDPFTGEMFQQDNALQHPEIIRALFLASRALERDKGNKKPKAKDPDLPGGAGAPWSEAEENELIAAFESGLAEKQLAESHQRTVGAIRARLVKLGKLAPAAAGQA
jgi:hypothetical protein